MQLTIYHLIDGCIVFTTAHTDGYVIQLLDQQFVDVSG